MAQIRIMDDQIQLVEEVSAFGRQQTLTEELSEEDLTEYKVRLDEDGFIPLSEFISLKEDNEGRAIVVIGSETENGNSLEIQEREVIDLDNLEEPPEVPKISNFENDSRRKFYNRLISDSESQPAIIRKIIFNAGELTRRELGELTEHWDYSADSGGISSSLVLLEEELGEIRRTGRGADQMIQWTGRTRSQPSVEEF